MTAAVPFGSGPRRGYRRSVRADHHPYVAAVRTEIEGADVGIIDLQTVTGPPRQALLTLDPEIAEQVFPLADVLLVRWDEEDGWSLLPRYPAGSGLGDVPIYMGDGPLPLPERVAIWVQMLLLNPALTPSREEGPYRDSKTHDPDYERRLAGYGTTPAPGTRE